MAYNTTSDRIANRILDTANTALGKNGLDFYKGGTAATFSTGTYCAIQFITESTLEGLTISGCNIGNADCNVGGESGLGSSTTIAAGTILYGDITALELAAADVAFLYKG